MGQTAFGSPVDLVQVARRLDQLPPEQKLIAAAACVERGLFEVAEVLTTSAHQQFELRRLGDPAIGSFETRAPFPRAVPS